MYKHIEKEKKTTQTLYVSVRARLTDIHTSMRTYRHTNKSHTQTRTVPDVRDEHGQATHAIAFAYGRHRRGLVERRAGKRSEA